jgi:hypothetical protein
MLKSKDRPKPEGRKTKRTPAKGNERKPPAFGTGKVLDRAIGPAAEEFGQELARLKIGARAAHLADWIAEQVEATPKRAKFVVDFVKNDVMPLLRHVDPRNWRKPKTLLLEKVLAGAQDSREEPELRDMFARLLASAMDPSASALVHPAFASAADQMAPVDAIVLRFIVEKSEVLKTTGGIPSLEAVWLPPPGKYFNFISKYRNFIGYPELKDLDVDTTQISISNLERLGLVETQVDRHLSTEEEYKSLSDSKFCQNFSAEARRHGFIAHFHRQILALTPFGVRLCALCIAEGGQRGSLGEFPTGDI